MRYLIFDGIATWLGHAFAWAARIPCALRGHDELLQFAAGRMFLRCTTCGHESPGWQVERRRLRSTPVSAVKPGRVPVGARLRRVA